MNNVAEFRKEAQKFLGKYDDIQVKQDGKFLLAYKDYGITKGHTGGDPRTTGEPVDRYKVEYCVINTLRNTATLLEIEAMNFVEEKGKAETNCVVYNVDKNGKYHIVDQISMDLFINPSKKTELTNLLKVVSEKNIQILPVIQDILDKFNNNQKTLNSFVRGIENLFKLDAASVIKRRQEKAVNR